MDNETPQTPNDGTPVVELRDVNKHFDDLHVLRDVNLSVHKGEVVVILGPSGSGKSTLCRTINRLETIDSGTILFHGEPLPTDPQQLSTLRTKVGMVFQSFNLLPMLTAKQNILLPLELAGRKPDKELFDQIVDELGIANRLGHRPSELSGGQQQRVACARAMVTRPSVVFADEPTGALDSKAGTRLLEYMRHSVDDRGQTIIMVTHDPRAASYADRALMLFDGRIVDDFESPQAETISTALASLEA